MQPVTSVANSVRKRSERAAVIRCVFGTAGLACILAYSLHLNLWNNDFPLGLHPDERRKARVARQADPYFLHPHVLYHSTRVAGAFTDAETHQDWVEAGRLTSGLFGTGIVSEVHEPNEFFPKRFEAGNFGAQIDLQMTVLSRLDMTLSLGLARAFLEGGDTSDEVMFSLKIL